MLLTRRTPRQLFKTIKTNAAVLLFGGSLRALAVAFRFSKKLRREIDNPQTGFVFDATIQFKTRDDAVNLYMVFDHGRVRVRRGVAENPNVTVFYKDKETLARIFSKSPEESLDYLLTNEMSYTGNMAYLTKFSYLTTLLSGGGNGRKRGGHNGTARAELDVDAGRCRRTLNNEVLGNPVDKVRFLDDPFLGAYTIDDFPRLKRLRNRRFALKPAVCSERAGLLTEFHRKHGFETDPQGRPLDRHLRQARAMHHILTHKRPTIWDDHLLAGSTTAKEVGVPVYPELIGTVIWPELKTISGRELNPNDLSPEDADVLNFEVFPFWMDRNVREHCRREHSNPLSQQLEERFVLCFMMKNNAISHTVPDLKRVLQEGLEKTLEQASAKAASAPSSEVGNFCQAVQIAVDGVLQYAKNLSDEALRVAARLNPDVSADSARIAELVEMARICRKVPASPAETVHEAVMSIWIAFTSLHVENADSALSIGRLDQLLQPFFVHDSSQAETPQDRKAVIERTIELVGSLFIKLNDHDPLVPNVGNKLFGGSSSDDTVTVGGVDSDGKNAVCDMTYIVLKAAEMLCLQDPNLNARYDPDVNSADYLRRLCEVNINMRASPIIHNDCAIIESLVNQGIPVEDARDWAGTGCVEPTISGKHYGHTNCMLLNMVAPLEMALNNGVHPVMGEQIGPQTGTVATAFPTYELFVEAYLTQLGFLIDQSVEINNYLGEAHQYVHPTPLLSSMFTGPLEKGQDLIDGGAVYNSSGVALVSVTDVVDSLMVIKRLVFEEQAFEFRELVRALEDNLEGSVHATLVARIGRVPKFGSGDSASIDTMQQVMDFVYDRYQSHTNYRGGKYWPGYWSISYHVGFGMLSGALPSGRKRGQAFTPGLTPAPGSTDNLLDSLSSVAALNHLKMPNNIAFNVKLVPSATDSHGTTLDHFSSYVKGYFDLGGMQWQFNVMSNDVLRDAMDHPEDYPWLLVRISGYNAYFVRLNRNMQQELIERTEFRA